VQADACQVRMGADQTIVQLDEFVRHILGET
jgi:hypothetical protein